MLQKTTCPFLGLSQLTERIGLLRLRDQWRTGALAPPAVVQSTACSLSGIRTLVSAFLLSRWCYLRVSHFCRSGPPRSLLTAGWQTLLLSRPQRPSGSSGSHSTSCLLLSKLTSAIQPRPGLSLPICASYSSLFTVGSSSLWLRHSTICLTERRSLFFWQWWSVPYPVLPGTIRLRSWCRRLCSPLPTIPLPLHALSRDSQTAPYPPATWPLGSTLQLLCLLLLPVSPCAPPILWSHDQSHWHDAYPNLSMFQMVGWPRSGLWCISKM